MTYTFTYLDKSRLAEVLPALFRILHSNMSAIAPTGIGYDADLAEWYSCVAPAMEKSPRQIVLMHHGEDLAGYFQYYVNDGVLMMEEIQLREEYHGSGLFGEFYRWLVGQLPRDLRYVEAYSHKNNRKSQGILGHLGMEACGESANGNSLHYRGDYADLVRRYFDE